MGIMKKLILKLYLIFLKKEKVERIALCVRPDNLSAIKLYKKLGFDIEKTVIFWIKRKIIFPHYKI